MVACVLSCWGNQQGGKFSSLVAFPSSLEKDVSNYGSFYLLRTAPGFSLKCDQPGGNFSLNCTEGNPVFLGLG
jgi:hypothetical protein